MTEQEILDYEMTDKDKMYVEYARGIFSAYNDSYKPHIIDMPSGQQFYSVKHTPKGYSLIYTDTERGIHKYVEYTSMTISNFITTEFLIIGKTSVEWNDIISNNAVQHYSSTIPFVVKNGIVFPFYYDGQIWSGSWNHYEPSYHIVNEFWNQGYKTEGAVNINIVEAVEPDCNIEWLKDIFIKRYTEYRSK